MPTLLRRRARFSRPPFESYDTPASFYVAAAAVGRRHFIRRRDVPRTLFLAAIRRLPLLFRASRAMSRFSADISFLFIYLSIYRQLFHIAYTRRAVMPLSHCCFSRIYIPLTWQVDIELPEIS